jgi:hypothetical protein
MAMQCQQPLLSALHALDLPVDDLAFDPQPIEVALAFGDGPGTAVSAGTSALVHRLHVVRVVSEPEVFGLDARRAVASVEDQLAGWNLSIGQRPHQPVRRPCSSIDVDASVTTLVVSAGPDAAGHRKVRGRWLDASVREEKFHGQHFTAHSGNLVHTAVG